MKKRILALLLAGLLTTSSLVSCVSSTNRPEDTGDKTEESQTRPTETTDNNNPITDPVTWNNVNETVYVVTSSLTLTSVNDSNTTVKAKLMEKLTRVKISTDGKRSVVEKDGVQYYVSSTYLNNTDLLGESFTACEPKTMYANGSVNVRTYASSDESFSKKIVTLQTNDTVTVVAVGDKWSKIEYATDTYYFVYSEYLSETKVVDPNTVDYSSYFEEYNQTLYITTDVLNVRKVPSLANGVEMIGKLSRDDQVTAIAKGTIDGMLWYQILFPDEVSAGQTQTYTLAYISGKYASTTQGSTEITLEDFLLDYPAFTELSTHKNMYVMANALNLRSTPEFPKDDKNIALTLVKKDALVLVATATIEDTKWGLVTVEVTEDNKTVTKFLFVGSPDKNLTTSPDGEPAPLTLEELTAKYNLTDIEDKTVYAKGDVLYNTAPSNPDASSTKKLEKNQTVTVVATCVANYAEWYVFLIEGDNTYYFAGSSHFSDTVQP